MPTDQMPSAVDATLTCRGRCPHQRARSMQLAVLLWLVASHLGSAHRWRHQKALRARLQRIALAWIERGSDDPCLLDYGASHPSPWIERWSDECLLDYAYHPSPWIVERWSDDCLLLDYASHPSPWIERWSDECLHASHPSQQWIERCSDLYYASHHQMSHHASSTDRKYCASLASWRTGLGYKGSGSLGQRVQARGSP